MNKKTLLRTAAVLSISATLLYSTVSCGVADLMKMPNTTYTLEHTDVENYISVTGKVEGSNIVKVTSEVSTKVKTLNVGIGSNVKEGDVLCVFDSSSFQEEYDRLKENSDMADEKSESVHARNAKALESAKSDKTEQLKQAQRVIDNANSAKERTQKKYNEAVEERDNYYSLYESEEDYYYKAYLTAKDVCEQLSDALIQCDNAIQDAKDAYSATEKRCNEAINAAQDMIDNEKYDKDTTIQGQLDKLQESIEKCTVKAPTDGIITSLSVAEGSMPSAEAIMTIEDNSKLRINVSINEADILNVQEGQKAIITTSATGDEKFTGKVSRVVNIMSGQKENAITGETSGGGYSAEITIDEGSSNLLIGMNAKVKIVMDQKDNVLAVPYDSIKENDDGTFSVFVAEKKDKGYVAKEYKITKGMETNYLTEIESSELSDGALILTEISGLADGDEVTVSEGYVDPESTEGE